MRTVDLIDSLATELRPSPAANPVAALAGAAVAGAAVALLAVVAIYGVQPGLTETGRWLPLAIKAAYAVALAMLALAATTRLARPDGGFRGWRLIGLPVAMLGAVAGTWLAAGSYPSLPDALFGSSWSRCPFRIAALSMPVLAALGVVMRGQAPTRLRRAGAAIGLAAGAVAALVYALACTENSPAFVLIWYSLGIALATGLGALLGPRLLRW